MMLTQYERLTFVAVLLLLQWFLYTFERVISANYHNLQSSFILARQYFAPLVVALVSLVFVTITFSGQPDLTGPEIPSAPFLAQACTADIDADVAGVGVRVAAWLQIGVLLIISLLGNFHSNVTGAKEVGAGLILTHASLATALLVQAHNRALNSLNAILGSMILDAQSAALLMVILDKTTLAARMQVLLTCGAQILGLIAQANLLSRFTANKFVKEDCTCLSVFWWAWLDSCNRLAGQGENIILWLYFGFRVSSVIQSVYHGRINCFAFHFAEPRCGEEGSEDQRKGKVVEKVTYPHGTNGQTRYGDYSSTLSVMVVIYAIFALASMTVAEVTIRDLGAKPSSPIESVGQIIPLTVAIGGILRAGYLFAMLFKREKDSGQLGFRWPPFRWPKVGRFSSQPRYYLTPYFQALWLGKNDPALKDTPASFPLGILLSEADYTAQRLGSIAIPEHAINRTTTLQASIQQTKQRTRWVDLQDRISTSKTDINKMTEESIAPEFWKKLLDDPEVLRHMAGRAGGTIFLVKGRMLMNGFNVTATKGWQDPRYEAVVRGERQPADLGLNPDRILTIRSTENEDVVLSYCLVAIIGHKGKVLRAFEFTQGASPYCLGN